MILTSIQFVASNEYDQREGTPGIEVLILDVPEAKQYIQVREQELGWTWKTCDVDVTHLARSQLKKVAVDGPLRLAQGIQ